MLGLKPWIAHTPEHLQKIAALNTRFHTESNCRKLLDRYSDVTSYILRNERNTLYNYLTHTTEGAFEYHILGLIAALHPTYFEIMQTLITLRDRANLDRTDPIPTTYPVAMTYFPKGITDFAPSEKILHETLSAQIQRELIKENTNDPEIPADHDDNKITIKVFANDTPNPYLHFYFNKRSSITIRRLWYKAIYHTFNMFKMESSLQNEEDINSIIQIITLFCYPESSFSEEHPYETAELLIQKLEEIVTKRIEHLEENIIDIFSAQKQTALNSVRKSNLESAVQYAEREYMDNVNRYGQLYNTLRNAQKALNEYGEIEFTAIKDFLNLIKKSPRTKAFGSANNNSIQFEIEEPLIHSDSAVWARYLTNRDSELNGRIANFAQNYNSKYNTNKDILFAATQRLYKEIFVDQKIKLYMSSRWYIDVNSSNFVLNRQNLAQDGNFLPHPHFASTSLTCTGNSMREITKNIMENNGEDAFLQLTYMLQQVTATDNVAIRNLYTDIINSRYAKVTTYLRKDKTERENFETIIKEFVQDETNKINTIFNNEN